MNPPASDISLASLLDEAETILARTMPPAIASAIIELARQGASMGTTNARATTTERAPGSEHDDELLTTREAADRLRVSEKQIYRLVAQGRLKRYGIGRSHKFRAVELAELFARSTDAARATRAARTAEQQRRAS